MFLYNSYHRYDNKEMQDEKNTQENKRICKKCLIRELAEKAEYKNMYDYIENLDPDIRAPEPTYEERLSVCKQCDKLLSGMCRACGCYVEMRAALVKNTCPYKKW